MRDPAPPFPEGSTCWTLIRAAAAGESVGVSQFAERYRTPVEAYLTARWRFSPLKSDIEDATQEVMFECLKSGGAITRATPDRGLGFRGFLWGVTRNIALRFETRWRRLRVDPLNTSIDEKVSALQEDDLDRVFDRAWAQVLVRYAAEELEKRAQGSSAARQRRVEILRLRFGEGQSIREIADAWNIAAKRLHKDYAIVREEYRGVLLDLVRWHAPRESSTSSAEAECRRLLALLE